MNCYVCDDAGRATPAVAICTNCQVGLCREHLDQDLLATGPGGHPARLHTRPGSRRRERDAAREGDTARA